MRLYALLIFFSISSSLSAANINSFFLKADRFFKQYVSDGQVNYGEVNSDDLFVEELVNHIGRINLEGLNDECLKAFYIDAYNILVIHSVAKHFPVASPLDIEGLFDKTMHTVAGKLVTLSDLENKVIRVKFDDARIHFALVCAAKGCPGLLSKAYNAVNVEDLLNEQTFKSLQSSKFVNLSEDGKSVRLSKIFEWYAEDFKVNGEKDIVGFINLYRKDPLPIDIPISYLTYDWSINAIE